jgi:hypothetical protein
VVDVTTAIEFDGRVQRYLGGHITRPDSCIVNLQGFVEIGYVCLVMLAVVQLHDLG